MKTFGLILGAVALIAALAVWRVEAVSARILETRYPVPADALTVAVAASDAKDGERLARLNGCFNCHGKALSGETAFTGMFGTQLTAPNLTRLVRHRTDGDLATAIRFGIKPDGTSLIGMPAGNFVKSSDGDVAAIIAYLRGLPGKPDAAPKTQWRFGGRVMLAVGLFPPEAALVDRHARGPRTTPTETLALGRYIANSQCTICHGRDLSGDPDEHSPDLRVVIAHYTLAKFQHFLTTGEGRPGHDTKIMAEIVKSRLRYLTPTQTAALYAYLKVPALSGQKQVAP